MAKASEGLLRRVVDQYADVKNDREPLSKEAARELAELTTLSVGMHAPKTDGVDLHGDRFKLTDYREKVVVLNFCNQNCRNCQATYPIARAWANRPENKRFVFLGVSLDGPEVLKTLRASRAVPWRFWVDDGPSLRKIAERWNVQHGPTFYVLDRNGTIRLKGVFTDTTLIKYEADSLVEEEGPAKKP